MIFIVGVYNADGKVIRSLFVFLFKQKTAYEMRISDWSSDVCSSDLFRQRSLCPQSAAVAARLGKADLMPQLLRLMGDDASAVIAAPFERLVAILRQRGFGCSVAAFDGGH